MPLAQGQILQNRYRIVNLLRKGGFGAVYRAWDANLNHPCAVKENLDTSAEAQRQFQLEATILANLSHPNLPHVYDHFLAPGQGQYLVMDFVEGEDLEQMLSRRGPLPEAEALAWIGQICDALDYLHGQNVIHRDIKPANIKITPAGKAMLVDFGIAKIYNPQMRTATGARLRVSLGYSPWEQYSQGRTDARSDVYALGATLYTLLIGQVPPPSTDLLGGTATLKPPLSKNPVISANTEKVILRAMVQQPTGRFQSATEMKQALLAASSQPAPTLPIKVGRPLWPIVVIGAIGLLLLIAALSSSNQTTPTPTLIVTPFTKVAAAKDMPALTYTPTASPTATERPTSTPTASPTATEQPTSTPTDSPTATEQPISTPTFTPTATPCTEGLFKKLWQRNRDRLGCPLSGWHSDKSFPPGSFGEMPFQKGHMFFSAVDAPKKIYVTYGSGDPGWTGAGEWEVYPTTWKEGDPDFFCTQERPYPEQPKQGFGEVWCNYPQVRQGLGWGIDRMRDQDTESSGKKVYRLQLFEGGLIFRDSDGWTHDVAYVFFDDGEFIRDSYL